MKKIVVSLAAASLLAVAALVVVPAAPAATSPPPTGWFDATAPPSAEAASLATRRGFIRTRQASFDANAAVRELVPANRLIAADLSGRTIVQPLRKTLVVGLLDGTPSTVLIDEVAVRASQGSEQRSDGAAPTVAAVEVLGHIGEANAAQSVVAFVFVPNVHGSYEMAGTIDNSPTSMATSIARVSGDTYSLGLIPTSGPLADEPVSGTSGSGTGGGTLAQPQDLRAYARAVAAADVPAGSPVANVDLMVMFANGNTADIKTRIESMVTDTNAALARSRINVRVELLINEAVNYNQAPMNLNADWKALNDGTGGLQAAHARRAESGVDLAVLVVPNQTTSCGLAPVPPAGGASTFRWGVITAYTGNCTPNYSFAHEVGHLLGGNHDPDNTQPTDPPFTYARGHKVSGKERDLMAYVCVSPETACERRLEYSNPDVPFINYPTLPSGTAERNNARSMRNLSYAVAAYDTRKPVWDVPGTDTFSTHIRWTVDQGLLTCGADLAFRKTETINRGQMAAVAYRRSGSPAYTPPDTSPFPDVPKTHTFYKVITWANSKGIMTGYSNGTFGPADLLTRGQTAVVLYDVMGKPTYTPPKTSPFPDVATTAYYYKAIMWMVDKGIASGYANGNFGPNDDVQRGQMAVFVYNSKAMSAAP